jgi:hypothetical protein
MENTCVFSDRQKEPWQQLSCGFNVADLPHLLWAYNVWYGSHDSSVDHGDGFS